MIDRGGSIMQLRLDVAESPASIAALWELMDEQRRAAAMALLAELMAQAVTASERWTAAVSEPGKLSVSHLRRSAFVYLRQSTASQLGPVRIVWPDSRFIRIPSNRCAKRSPSSPMMTSR
jgi:hypothetical protein